MGNNEYHMISDASNEEPYSKYELELVAAHEFGRFNNIGAKDRKATNIDIENALSQYLDSSCVY